MHAKSAVKLADWVFKRNSGTRLNVVLSLLRTSLEQLSRVDCARLALFREAQFGRERALLVVKHY